MLQWTVNGQPCAEAGLDSDGRSFDRGSLADPVLTPSLAPVNDLLTRRDESYPRSTDLTG
jgi:hypothetical protein